MKHKLLRRVLASVMALLLVIGLLPTTFATTEEKACHIHPNGFWLEDNEKRHQDWYLPCDVTAMLIGQTERYKEGAVILSDYKA